MSRENSRTLSPQSPYMKLINTSTARSRKSTSRSDSSSPVLSSPMETLNTPQNSPPPSPARTSATSTPVKPAASAVSKDLKNKGTPSRAGPAPLKNPSSSKPTAAKPNVGSLAADGRKRIDHDDARAVEEDRMGAEMARIAKDKGLIDEETARNWSTPWHAKGALEQQWSEEVRQKQNAEDGVKPVPEAIMSLEEAQRIKLKNDADLEEWCAAFEAGIIDAQGMVVVTGEDFEPGEYNKLLKTAKRDTQQLQKSRKAIDGKKSSPIKVVDSKFVKSTAFKKVPEMTIIDETNSVVSQPTAKKATKPHKKATNPSPSGNASSNNSTAIEKEKPKAGSSRNDDDFCLLPLPGLPNYQQFKYNHLTALLRERMVRSGGGEERCRNRLIQDDIHIVNEDWEKRDARDWKHENREVKTEAPEVPNMPVAPPAKFTAAMRQARKALKTNLVQDGTHPYAPIKPQNQQADEESQSHSPKRLTLVNKRDREDEDEDEDGGDEDGSDDGTPPASKKLKAT